VQNFSAQPLNLKLLKNSLIGAVTPKVEEI